MMGFWQFLGDKMGNNFSTTFPNLTESQIAKAGRLGITLDEMRTKIIRLNNLETPDVSIIIPVYNGEKFIKECVESALNQTYDSFEVIIVDDGSTDRTLDIITGIDGTNILIKSNGGTASALNTGIRNAKGNWIHWLSADDVLYPEAVEIMIKEIGLTPVNHNYIYYSNYDIIDENSDVTGEFIEPLQRNFKTKEERFQELLGNYYGNGSSTMIHKSVFEKIRFDEEIPYFEDYDFMLNAMKNGIDMKLVSKKTLKYRRHSGQLTNRVDNSLANKIRNKYRI